MGGRPIRVRLSAILFETAALAVFTFLALWQPWALAAKPTGVQADALRQAQDDAIERRSASIDKDLKRMPGHAWAGSYYEGDGLGSNVWIRVSPFSGVVATLDGCLGRYDQNEGQVLAEPDGSLHFAYNLQNERPFGGFPSDVHPLNWSGRRYLIPKDKLADFVAAINQGREPRASGMGSFLLADGDEYKTVDGLPPLPRSYREWIRSRPVRAEAVGATLALVEPGYEKMCRKHYRVDLRIEEGASLAPGEILAIDRGNDYSNGDLTIQTVGRGSAVGMVDMFEIDCDNPESVPKAGWMFTTGAYDRTRVNKEIKEINEAAKERRSRRE